MWDVDPGTCLTDNGIMLHLIKSLTRFPIKEFCLKYYPILRTIGGSTDQATHVAVLQRLGHTSKELVHIMCYPTMSKIKGDDSIVGYVPHFQFLLVAIYSVTLVPVMNDSRMCVEKSNNIAYLTSSLLTNNYIK